MSQERLSELAILPIKKEILAELECKNLISNLIGHSEELCIVLFWALKKQEK